MGGGGYSVYDRSIRATTKGYTTKSASEIFARKVNSAMNPNGLVIRESRDSAEHPESLAIVLALDVTGSMGSIPHYLVKQGLPHLMDTIIKSGLKHPQLLFLGIGDDTCDQAPLQVGQFESSDELLDKWLTDLWLEGHGGGNDGESYFLAWYIAGKHTSIDCFEKRKQKGILFTIGDEPNLPKVSGASLKSIMGPGQYSNFNTIDFLELAKQKYECFHIHMMEGTNGHRQDVINRWRQIMGPNLITCDSKTDLPDLLAKLVVDTVGVQGAIKAEEIVDNTKESVPETPKKKKVML